MDYYLIFGMVVVALVAIVGFLMSIKKSIMDERKPMEDLNVSITRLNVNFENMISQDKVRDRRIENHGREIDELVEAQHENDLKFADHDSRLKILEHKREVDDE